MKTGNLRLGTPTVPTWIVGGLRWRLSPTGTSVLGPEHLDLRAHLRNGTAQVIKNGPHRAVYRIDLEGHSIFWKHCKINGLAALGRQFIRPPKARMEFDCALALAARGIPTVEPLAWGKPWWQLLGPSHLITRELPDAIPLHTWLFDRSRGRVRREAAVELGRYLAQLHEAGVVHPDLHPGNVLVADVDGRPRFHLLDIHNVRLGPSLGPDESRENLVIFNRWFFPKSERSDRARFWHSYAEARRLEADAARIIARGIEKRMGAANIELWTDRDDRCFRANRHFHRVKSSQARGHAVNELDAATLERLLANPDAPFHEADALLLKDSPTSSVAEIVVDTPDGPLAMIWKRFNLKKRGATLANRFRRSAALRSWQMGQALLDRDLPTPRPWLVLHRRGMSGPREGYLLCEKVQEALELREFLHRLPFDEPGRKRHAIAVLGRLLQRFHESGLSHRDLKASNLLVSTKDGEPRFHFIDLVGVRRGEVSDALRAHDLGRLAVSFLQDPHLTRIDRLRFLRAYQRWALHGRGDWKKWWRWIDQVIRGKIERNRQSGRPLN